MPVRERKIWIQRHNIEQERLKGNDNHNGVDITGEAINKYASMEQKKNENNVPF